VIEMAAASGLTLLGEQERDPRVASTHGTGDLIRAALDHGSQRVIVGAGGSATNDGGAGAAQALEARLLDDAGDDLEPGGAELARLARIDVAGIDTRLAATEVVVATDVRSPLCGPDGASMLYGAQKGASPDVARELDDALSHYAGVVKRDLGVDVRGLEGAGAAGGLAAGLVAFCGASIQPGFDVVAEAVGLAERIAAADAVVTGEGRLDRQSAFGKTTAGVARMARRAGKPVLAVVGSVSDEEAGTEFDAVFPVVPKLSTADQAMARAAAFVSELAEEVGAWLSRV
jgi:glycerate kinase